MLPSTQAAFTALAAVLNADSSLGKVQIKTALSVLASAANAKAIEIPDRILRRPEVAKLLGVSVKRIDQLAQRGILSRVVLPGTSRAIGYREADIRAITERRRDAE